VKDKTSALRAGGLNENQEDKVKAISREPKCFHYVVLVPYRPF
jgi:hypothetical protein